MVDFEHRASNLVVVLRGTNSLETRYEDVEIGPGGEGIVRDIDDLNPAI